MNNHTLLIEAQNEGGPVTPCMDVYKAKIQSDRSLDNLKLRIVVGGDLQNKELVGDTWSPTALHDALPICKLIERDSLYELTDRKSVV